MTTNDGKIKRRQLQTFVNTTPDSPAPTYCLLGNGVTDLSINYNAQSVSETYIHEETASIETENYNITAKVAAKAFYGDPVFGLIDEIRQKRALGSGAKTDIVNVFLYNEKSDGCYACEKQTVSVQIDSFGGRGGEDLYINFTLNYVGDPQYGVFDLEQRAFAAQGGD